MNLSEASFVNLREGCFVRLACVKHAASVHPEPGSNSHVHSLLLNEQELVLANLVKTCP